LSIVVGTRTAFINVTITVVVDGVTELGFGCSSIAEFPVAISITDLVTSSTGTHVVATGTNFAKGTLAALVDGTVAVVVQTVANFRFRRVPVTGSPVAVGIADLSAD
jgi:hypothetical protein